ncbi:MAG: hypothetical protein AAFN43_06375 [Pseudomonadota bacterium]
MAKSYDYSVTSAQQRFAERKIVTIDACNSNRHPADATRLVIPFSGFDGQKLAGSGALVWEGELLH